MKDLKHISRLCMGALALLAIGGLTSCDDDDDRYPTVSWANALSTKYENPALMDRTEDGLLEMTLWSDNTLSYSIYVNRLQSGDALTSASLYAGDVMSNGNIVLDLKANFTGFEASGKVPVRASLADSLRRTSNQIYLNVTSTEKPAGLIRGQINTDILYTSAVSLSGDNEVPPVSTTANGLATVRVTTEGWRGGTPKMYSNVTVNFVESGDQVTSASIYRGAYGETGDSFVALCNSENDFNLNQSRVITQGMVIALQTGSYYVNTLSLTHPDGIVRSQLNNQYINPILLDGE